MDLSPGKPFCILNLNESSAVINIPNREWAAMTCSPPLEIMHNKFDEALSYPFLRLLPVFVNFVHYKPSSDNLQNMHEHKTVQRNEDVHPNNDGWEKLTIVGRYGKKWPEFLKLLEKFEVM